MLLVQAGNRIDSPERTSPRFPAWRVADVRARVARLLVRLAPIGVVTGGAAGSDLIVASEAERLEIPVHLVLAAPAPAFRAESVADQGDDWGAAFDRALRAAASVRVASHPAGCDPFRSTNRALLERARELAGDDLVVGLAVRPSGGERPPGVTDDFVERAEAEGIQVLGLDPLADSDPGDLA